MRRSHWSHIWITVVILAAAALRTAGWDNWSYWLDEAMQVDYVRRTFVEMWKAVVFDGVHPPFDYIVMWAWYRASSAEAWLRTLPVLWSCITVLAIYVRAGGAHHPVRSLAAASAFASFPLAVYLGQELRPYAAGLCFAALFDAARSRHESNGRASSLVAAGVFGVLASWTLYWAGLYVAFSWLVDLIRSTRHRDRTAFSRAALTSGVTFLLFVPWLVALAGSSRASQPSSSPQVSVGLVLRFAGGLVADRQEDVKQPVAAVVIWAFVVAGLVLGPKLERWRVLTAAALFSAGVLAALCVAGHWWALRYLTVSLLPLSLAIGFLAERIASWLRNEHAVAATSFVLLFLLQRSALADSSRWARPDWRRPAEYLAFMSGMGFDGPVAAADPWAYFALRAQFRDQRNKGDVVLRPDARGLEDWIRRTDRGWVVRAPHFAAPDGIDGMLSSEPWGQFRRAEEARLFRVSSGRIVDP